LTYLLLTHQRRPEWQDAINKLSIDFTVFLIDGPPTHNLRLLFVELDRRREAPKIFCLMLANGPYVINYLCASHTLPIFLHGKVGAKLLSGPRLFRMGGSGPLAPVTAPLAVEIT
jgi:hypothetical protein